MSTAEITPLVRRQHAILTRILQLTRRIGELIRSQSHHEIAAVVAEQHSQVRILRSTQAALASYQPCQGTRRAQPNTQETVTMASECETILRHILDAEQDNQAALTRYCDTARVRFEGNRYAPHPWPRDEDSYPGQCEEEATLCTRV